MPSKRRSPYARIAITLPRGVLAAADRLARRLDRSRSWVVAEAVRRFAEEGSQGPSPAMLRDQRLVDQAGSASGLGSLRQAQLEADLRLTPEKRVRTAEDTARVGRRLQPSRGARLLLFTRPEDYLRWKQRAAAGA